MNPISTARQTCQRHLDQIKLQPNKKSISLALSKTVRIKLNHGEISQATHNETKEKRCKLEYGE